MRKVFGLTMLLCLAMPFSVMAQPPARVTVGGDSGPGSLREALEGGATQITINPGIAVISLVTPLVYAGTDPLSIHAAGQVIDGTALADGEAILFIEKGADLTINNLIFQGKGGYSIENQGGGVGILLDVPVGRQGIVHMDLNRVAVFDTGDHGILINDCSEPECGGGAGGEGDGSEASIHARLANVLIEGAGFGKQDGDGFRANERGLGDITLEAVNSEFNGIGGDGIELDENQDGSVFVHVRNTSFRNNGAYCYDGGDLDFDAVILLDPNCNDDGEADVDDAFDIDEGGPGALAGTINNVYLTGNYDEGLDFDVLGTGDNTGVSVDLDFINVFAHDNAGDGIKVSDEGEDDMIVRMTGVETNDEIQLEKLKDGDLIVKVQGLDQTGDEFKIEHVDEDGLGGDGDVVVDIAGSNSDDDLEIEETWDGSVYLTLKGSTFDDVDVQEDDAGDLNVVIRGSVIDTLSLEQDGSGDGTVSVRGSSVNTLDLEDVVEL